MLETEFGNYIIVYFLGIRMSETEEKKKSNHLPTLCQT